MKSDNKTSDRLLDAVGGIRDVWLEDAEALYENGKQERQGSGFSRFLHSGWAVAAACLITAVGVYTAVMIAGRSAGGPGIAADPGNQVIEIDAHEVTDRLKPPESISLASVTADGVFLQLRPWAYELSYPVTDEDGKQSNVHTVADARCAPHDAPDSLPYLWREPEDYLYGAGDHDVTLYFNGELQPANLTVKAFRTDSQEIAVSYIVIDMTVDGLERDDDARSWKLVFDNIDDIDEPVIVEIKANWSGKELSGSVTYAFIRLPQPSSDLTDLVVDRGLAVYAWKMSVDSAPKFFVVPDKNAPGYLTPIWAPGKTANEMKQILSAYDLPPEDVTVLPFNISYSSYLWGPERGSGETYEEWQARTVKELREMLGIPLPEDGGTTK